MNLVLTCPEFQKSFEFKDFIDHKKSHKCVQEKSCPIKCGKIMHYDEFEDHSNGYGGEHFMKLCGIEPGNSFAQDRCSKLIQHCNICKKKVDPVKAHEHQCLKDLLFKVQGEFMIENMAS
jgi:hypothetical protein